MLLVGELLCGVSQDVSHSFRILADHSLPSSILSVPLGRVPDPYRRFRFGDLPRCTATISHDLRESMLGLWAVHRERVSASSVLGHSESRT